MEKSFKTCTKCKINKPQSSFRFRADRKGKLLSWCNKCHNSHQRENYSSDKARARTIKRKYNISMDVYDFMLNSQNGNCKICGINHKELKKPLYIDHDHKNGKIRGLLCGECNTMLGMAKDSISILNNSIKYLIENEGV